MSKPSFDKTAMMWRLAMVCLGLLWVVQPAFAQLGTGTIDPRMRATVTPETHPDADAVLVLDDIRFEVEEDRSHTFDEHDAIKVLTPEGVEENSSLVRVVDTSKQKIEVLTARTVKADGRVINSPPPEYSPLLSDSEVYRTVNRFTLTFPQLEVGDLVEFHLRTTHFPKTGGHFWATTYVQNPMPILDSTFTVEIPKGVPFRTATPGHPEAAPERTEVERDGTTYEQLRWDTDEEPAYEIPPLSPPPVTLLKRIEVSSFLDWEQLAEYLEREWQAHNRYDEGLALRVAGWLPVAGNLETRASGLLRELNRNRRVAGFLTEKPEFHDPRDLLDEKVVATPDASILASVALAAANIPNIPVATFGVSRESLQDELPIPEKVSKIILKIPQYGGDHLWFDPENPGFVLNVVPANTSGSAALSWDPRFQTVGLVELPIASAFHNREELAVEGRLERSGRAELTVQYDRYGTLALDSRQAAREIQEGPRETRDRMLESFFQNTARSYGPRARLLSQFFELDPDTMDPFTLSFTVAVPGYAQVQDGTQLVPLPRFLSSAVRAAARGRNRSTALVFEEPYQQDVRIHLIFPEGSEVLNAPESIRKQTPEAEFVAQGRAEGNEVWYVGRLTVFDAWTEGEALKRGLEVLEAATRSEDTIIKVQLSAADATSSPSVEELLEDDEG